MQRILALFALSLIAGCASAPRPSPPPGPGPITPSPHIRSDFLGLTAAQLIQQLGTPALQIREGAGLKLQFRGGNCVVDAYLYPSAAGSAERVTHVDARDPNGIDRSQPDCIALLQRR